jgi:anti-sigma factor RsiW
VSCSKFETDIALYAGGDLPDGRTARVASHLAECADCRALADELHGAHALLGELREEPLEDAMVAQVRQRVLAEVRHSVRRANFSPRVALYPLLALAAAVILAIVLAWPRRQTKRAPAVPAAPIEASIVAPAPPEPLARVLPARHRIVRHHQHVPAPKDGPPLLVQFVTDDPNIVIYWLIDQKPQGD